MTVTVEIPDALAAAFVTQGGDPSRAVIEAIALEGYRSDRLSEYEIQQLLGFETRMEVHGFLKEHGAFMHYTLEDVERDTAAALEVARRYRARKDATPAESPVG